MKTFEDDKIEEIGMIFKKGKYLYLHESDRGKPAFERCVELPWIADKISQLNLKSKETLFDFGCNKAEYIRSFKKQYGITTYGIDVKRPGKKYVDHFFRGAFNNDLKIKITSKGPYRVCTAISAVEHAGAGMHPRTQKITDYQRDICQTLIRLSGACLISVPYGRRPGWAKDKSRTNLYQFNHEMLDHISSFALALGKNYLEEFYKLERGIWIKSNRENTATCRYRKRKLGASAIALISVWM